MPVYRVLLVDDEETFVTVLAERLTARGFQPFVAFDGEQALAFLRDADVDVVVLDIGLPGKSGLEVLGDIRALRPYTQVVMLTGAADVATAVAGMKLGAFDYLVKPADVEVLKQSLQAAIGHKASQEEGLRMLETDKLASLGVLAEGVAHEINNPVNIMVNEAGWIEEILGESELENSKNMAEVKQSVDRIKRQGRRCREITEKLLTLSGRIDPRPQEIRLDELLVKLAEKALARAGTIGVSIETELANDLPAISCSPAQMEQALQSLIDNALDAMETTGKGILRLTAKREAAEVVITVTDSGIGIDPLFLTRIFEPFFSTKKVGKGTGLGLSIAYSTVKAMGGGITAASELGCGTTFTVRLPASKSA
jgi:two-component system, NtrC family, sensor kinase